ncbi:MAG: hypothetical protein AABW64_01455 [Nanoarchaeota archaeon]
MRKNFIIASVCIGILLLAFALQSTTAEGREKEIRTSSDHERVLVTDILESIPQEQRERIQRDMDSVDEANIVDLFLVQAKTFSEKK